MAAILVVIAAGPQPRGERGSQLPTRARDWRAGVDPRNAAQRAPNHPWPVARLVETIPAGVGIASGCARISNASRAVGTGTLCRARRGRGRPGSVYVRRVTDRGAVFLTVVQAFFKCLAEHTW